MQNLETQYAAGIARQQSQRNEERSGNPNSTASTISEERGKFRKETPYAKSRNTIRCRQQSQRNELHRQAVQSHSTACTAVHCTVTTVISLCWGGAVNARDNVGLRECAAAQNMQRQQRCCQHKDAAVGYDGCRKARIVDDTHTHTPHTMTH